MPWWSRIALSAFGAWCVWSFGHDMFHLFEHGEWTLGGLLGNLLGVYGGLYCMFLAIRGLIRNR